MDMTTWAGEPIRDVQPASCAGLERSATSLCEFFDSIDGIRAAARSGQGHREPLLRHRAAGWTQGAKELLDSLEVFSLGRPSLTAFEFAHHLGVSSRQLTRKLRSTGMSFRTLRRAVTVRATMPQILQTTELISQIAYRAGYEHVSQFNRDVRYLIGISPSELRQLARRSL
jgi:AraC-like DNA-binding protein